MKKEIILLFVIVIGVCFVSGCVTQSKSTTPRVITPTPTLKTDFKINEPASDGVLRITVVSSSNFANSIPYSDRSWISKIIVLKLENLRSDRTIHLLPSDFRLIDSNNNEFTNGYFYGKMDTTKFDLFPGQREQVSLAYDFGTGTDMNTLNKLKFDFSSSGGNTGSPIVYFSL